MNDEPNDPNEDGEHNFFCFPSFHTFWKAFPKMKPFFRKGYWPMGYWSTQGLRIPITHVKRDQEKYNITMEIPGISQNEINLEATNDELWFSAQSAKFKNQYKHHFHFKRQIQPNQIKAHLKAGILKITAPLAEKVPITKVDVE